MVQYIDKSTVQAEIERRIKERDLQMKSGRWVSSSYVYEDLLDFLDHLEIKEMDLEKEIDDWYNTMGIPVTADALKETARHFFGLGLNIQK